MASVVAALNTSAGSSSIGRGIDFGLGVSLVDLHLHQPVLQESEQQAVAVLRESCSVVTLHAGELAYWPSHWWHESRNLEPEAQTKAKEGAKANEGAPAREDADSPSFDTLAVSYSGMHVDSSIAAQYLHDYKQWATHRANNVMGVEVEVEADGSTAAAIKENESELNRRIQMCLASSSAPAATF